MRIHRPANRVRLAGRPADYQTYQVFAPLHSHWRRASCDEVGCPTVRPARCDQIDCARYHHGWRTIIPATRLDLIRTIRTSGRRFTEKPAPGGLIEFVFPAGQQCFDSMVVHRMAGGPCQEKHVLPVGRPGIFVVQRGLRHDRALPPPNQFSGVVFGERVDLWLEHFAEHLQKLADQRNRI